MITSEYNIVFDTRSAPWSGLGTNISNASNSAIALRESGLDWTVLQSPVYTETGDLIPGFKANIRNTDSVVLGIVSDKYQVLQNEEAYRFTDELIGEGVTYETAGSFQSGRRSWIMAKLPQRYSMVGDEVSPYIMFMNSHDGSCSVKVVMTPIRVACQNTLNLALKRASRIWSTRHTESILARMDEARTTLFKAERYMFELNSECENLCRISLSDSEAVRFIDELFPYSMDMTAIQRKNSLKMRNDLRMRYFEAPDLTDVGKNAYRFINAVSDFATHSEPLRKTKNYRENLLLSTAEGNPLIDRAYEMMLAA